MIKHLMKIPEHYGAQASRSIGTSDLSDPTIHERTDNLQDTNFFTVISGEIAIGHIPKVLVYGWQCY